MAVLLDELERGAVCLAIYPFTPEFPLEVVVRAAEESPALSAQLETYDTIESLARIERREVVTEVKLRPVLLLQTGTAAQRSDVVVARINSITDDHREKRANWVLKLQNDIHPVMVMVGHEARHGLRHESYINLTAVQTISKRAILRRLGTLTEDEMSGVSDRLIRSLEIDVSAYVERLRPAATETTSEPEQPS